eukprot:3719215-Amphidinium_carterae.1
MRLTVLTNTSDTHTHTHHTHAHTWSLHHHFQQLKSLCPSPTCMVFVDMRLRAASGNDTHKLLRSACEEHLMVWTLT